MIGARASRSVRRVTTPPTMRRSSDTDRSPVSQALCVQFALQSRGVKTVKNLINGKFEDSKASEWIKVYNPATQEVRPALHIFRPSS